MRLGAVYSLHYLGEWATCEAKPGHVISGGWRKYEVQYLHARPLQVLTNGQWITVTSL